MRASAAPIREPKAPKIPQNPVTNCRMTGFQLPGSGVRDAVFDGCRADLANFRFTHMRDVVFRDCNLSEAGFQQAELHNVRFDGALEIRIED